MRCIWAGAVCAFALVLSSVSVRAQPCGRWVQGSDRGIAGVVGTVFDMVVCDPDGAGPMGTMLVVAGDFQVAGDLESRFVVGWDGSRWVQMGTGLQYGVATSLALHEGHLYVGGSFSGRALSNVAWWDGAQWQFVVPGPIGEVRALRSYRGELVVGGNLTGVPPNLSAVGVAVWNSNGWHALGAGLNGGVAAMTEMGDRLVVGGSFTSAGGMPIAGVAAWDGAGWSALGAGGADPTAEGVRVVRALQMLGGSLYVGGEFGGVGGVAASGLARWDGATWSAVSHDDRRVVGLGEDAGRLVVSHELRTEVWNGTEWRDYAPIGQIFRVATFSSQTHIGGDFRVGGGAWRWGLAKLQGGTWDAISRGIDNPVLAILEHEGKLIAGGEFRQIGGASANGVAAWDGGRWTPIGDGFDRSVRALTTFRGELVAGGDFTSSGGSPCGHLASWDGTQWRPSLGVEVPGSVVAAAEYRDALVFAVQFAGVGTDPAFFSVYASDGAGITALAFENVGVITKFFLHEDRLLVGGNFASIGGFASRNLAAWDGESWQTVDNWQRGPVLSLGTYKGDLVVGASFRDGVWRLSSQSRLWTAVGRGLSSGATALVEYHGRLLAIGGFHLAEGQIADGLAAWDGSRWSPFGTGLARQRGFSVANGAVVFGDEVIAAGAFDHVDGVVSVNWARWKECPADMDDGQGNGVCDGGVSIDDLFYFLELFGTGNARADIATRDGEIGADGEVTAEDLAVYLRRFEGGC